MNPIRHIDVACPDKMRGLWKNKTRFKVLYGGRGSGKTHQVASYLIVQSLLRKEKVLCTREIQRSIKESVHAVLVSKINALGLDKYFTATENKISNVLDSEFIFAG